MRKPNKQLYTVLLSTVIADVQTFGAAVPVSQHDLGLRATVREIVRMTTSSEIGHPGSLTTARSYSESRTMLRSMVTVFPPFT